MRCYFKFFALPFFLFIIVLTTNGQQTYPDSIYHNELIRVHSKDSVKKYLKSENERNIIPFFKTILSLAEEKKDTLRIISTLHFLGRTNNQYLSEFKTSNSFFKKELSLLKKVTNPEILKKLEEAKITEIEVLAQMGQNYEDIGQVKKAFDIFYKCEKIAKEKDLEFYKVIMPTLIANLHFKVGDYRSSLVKEYESYNGLKNSKTISDGNKKYNRGEISIDISNSYLKLNKKDSALWILTQGEKEGLDVFTKYAEIRFTEQKGKVYLEKKKFLKALSYLEETQKLADNYDNVAGSIFYYENLAECYFKLKKYNKAIQVMLKGIAAKKQNTKEYFLVNDYKTLAKFYKQSGNLQKSNEYYEKYVLNQKAFENSKKDILTSFHSKKVSDLELEKELQKTRTIFYVIGSSIFILLLLLFLLHLSKKRKDNAQKFQELLLKIESLEQQQKLVDTKDEVLEEKSISDINKETFDEILTGLQKIEEQHYYLKQECNSYNVAKKIKTNTSYLSKAINSHHQKNFNTYINDLRINYAILKLKEDTRFRSYSIQSISEDIGYKSPDSFTKYFKRRTGLLPSVYIKKLNLIT